MDERKFFSSVEKAKLDRGRVDLCVKVQTAERSTKHGVEIPPLHGS